MRNERGNDGCRIVAALFRTRPAFRDGHSLRSRMMEMSGFAILVLFMALVVIGTAIYVVSGNGD
jgi:cytochrome b561